MSFEPRTFESLDGLWMATLGHLLDHGTHVPSRDGDTLEILGYSARLASLDKTFLFNPIRRACPAYGAAEFLWYLSGTRNIGTVVAYAPQYVRFVSGPEDDGVNAHGAYGYRWQEGLGVPAGRSRTEFPAEFWRKMSWKDPKLCLDTDVGQLHALIWLLKNKPDSRQAIMSMWEPNDLFCAIRGGNFDIPCTLSLNFLIRDGKLNLTATMRSNDVWLGTPYDVFCFTALQRLIAEVLEIPTGWYQHNVMSMHLYARNVKKASEVRAGSKYTIAPCTFTPHRGLMKFMDLINDAVALEFHIRRIKAYNRVIEEKFGVGSFLEQLLVLILYRLAPTPSNLKRITNSALRDYCEKKYQKRGE